MSAQLGEYADTLKGISILVPGMNSKLHEYNKPGRLPVTPRPHNLLEIMFVLRVTPEPCMHRQSGAQGHDIAICCRAVLIFNSVPPDVRS